MNVFTVTYNIKMGRRWHGGHNGFDHKVVVVRGDARRAASKVEALVLKENRDIQAVDVISVVRIAGGVAT